jgi:hypothetical protein
LIRDAVRDVAVARTSSRIPQRDHRIVISGRSSAGRPTAAGAPRARARLELDQRRVSAFFVDIASNGCADIANAGRTI